MLAMAMKKKAAGVLEATELPRPDPAEGQILIEVSACGVCRTDLHVVDGDLPDPKLPIVPGHEIVGRVATLGAGVRGFEPGERVGVPWLGSSCGRCRYCRGGRENLCEKARYTGYQLDGGYAEYVVADHRYVFRLPEAYADAEVAPLLCAGLIGYRSYRMALETSAEVLSVGLYGFGAAAHIIAQVARHDGKDVYAFTRPDDERARELALQLGASWAGPSAETPPAVLDAAIVFAPVGPLVPVALRAIARGGVVVCAGIHMSDIPSFPYRLLWEERIVRSVANLTRRDAEEFLALAPRVPITTHVTEYPLDAANAALEDLREGRQSGAAVLRVDRAGAGYNRSMSEGAGRSLPKCEFEHLEVRHQATVPADPAHIDAVVERILQITTEMECAAGKEFEIETAIREALANAIVHGCKQDPTKKVNIWVACDESRGMVIVIRDPGGGFDPDRIPNPVVGRNLYSEHGRGIYLINRLMDEVRFERGGTEIWMRKG